MDLVDHVFVLILAIVYPIYDAVSFLKYVREIKAGKQAEPVKLYRESMRYGWIALAVLATA